MAADVLATLVRVDLVGAAAVVLVMLLRRPVRRLAGPRAAYRLWLAPPLAAAASLLPARQMPGPALSPPPNAEPVAPPVFASIVDQGAPIAMHAADLAPVLVTAWIAGAVLSLTLAVVLQWRSLAKLGRLARIDGRLYRAESPHAGPAVVGGLWPRIVLPSDFEQRFPQREREVVIAHEEAHLSSFDAQVNAFVVLSQCIFWFNPLVHIAAFLVRLDQELACDAAVLARYPEARRSYAEALLKTQLAPAPLPLGCYWPARSAHPLKERLAMLNRPPPGRGRRLAGALSVLTVSLGAAYAAWAANPPVITAQQRAEATAAAMRFLDERLTAAKADAAKAQQQADALAEARPGSPEQLAASDRAVAAAQLADALEQRQREFPSDAAPSNIAQLSSAPRESVVPPPPRAEDVVPGPNGALAFRVRPSPPSVGLSNAVEPPLALPFGLGPASLSLNPDGGAPVLLRGRVVRVEMVSPHSTIHIVLDDGRRWAVQGGAANTLLRNGVNRQVLGPEAEIIVRGYQPIDKSCADECPAIGADITTLDGSRFPLWDQN